MIQELDQIVLTVNIPEHDLRAGDVGTVVDIHTQGAPGTGYSVEFQTMSGATIAVLELEEAQIRATRPTDMVHVREVASA